jgi:hypothetical protein
MTSPAHKLVYYPLIGEHLFSTDSKQWQLQIGVVGKAASPMPRCSLFRFRLLTYDAPIERWAAALTTLSAGAEETPTFGWTPAHGFQIGVEDSRVVSSRSMLKQRPLQRTRDRIVSMASAAPRTVLIGLNVIQEEFAGPHAIPLNNKSKRLPA